MIDAKRVILGLSSLKTTSSHAKMALRRCWKRRRATSRALPLRFGRLTVSLFRWPLGGLDHAIRQLHVGETGLDLKTSRL